LRKRKRCWAFKFTISKYTLLELPFLLHQTMLLSDPGSLSRMVREIGLLS
jgi:hypothetical protein